MKISSGREQLLVVTIFLALSILSALLLGWIVDPDFFPLAIPMILVLDMIYVGHILKSDLPPRKAMQWIVLVFLFGLFSLPFLWKKMLWRWEK